MPIYDISGNLRVVSDRANQIAVYDTSGVLVSNTAQFLQFSGSAVANVTAISSGVLINLQNVTGSNNSNFTKGLIYNYPIMPKNTIIWRSEGNHVLSNIRGLISGSPGATASFQAAKNGSTLHLSATMHITLNNSWFNGGGITSPNYTNGDYLQVRLLGISGTVEYAIIQFDFTS